MDLKLDTQVHSDDMKGLGSLGNLEGAPGVPSPELGTNPPVKGGHVKTRSMGTPVTCNQIR